MICSFFGHRDAPETCYSVLEKTIEELIVHENADEFYVGTHGNFDAMALRALRALKQRHPSIRYSVVLAYMPIEKEAHPKYLPEETIYPEGLEETPYRFAITKRNRWMVRRCDCAIVYITRRLTNGAAAAAEYAARLNRRIINIGR